MNTRQINLGNAARLELNRPLVAVAKASNVLPLLRVATLSSLLTWMSSIGSSLLHYDKEYLQN
jgi:hypothetical protein